MCAQVSQHCALPSSASFRNSWLSVLLIETFSQFENTFLFFTHTMERSCDLSHSAENSAQKLNNNNNNDNNGIQRLNVRGEKHRSKN